MASSQGGRDGVCAVPEGGEKRGSDEPLVLVPDDEGPKPKKPKAPKYRLSWDAEAGDFAGEDRAAIGKAMRAHYQDEFGKEWMDRTWLAMTDWCLDNPELIKAKKDFGRFVLGWFRREAARRREKEDET